MMVNAGMDPEDLGKAMLLQKALLESGASPEKIAKAMKDSMLDSGMTLDHMMKLMEIELKASPKLTGKDVSNTLQLEKVLGAGKAADMILRKLSPETQKLLEELAKGVAPGKNGQEGRVYKLCFCSVLIPVSAFTTCCH